MALVTNANSGMGMLACYENAIAGRGCVVGVAQRDYSVLGEQEALFLDRLHDTVRFFRIKCDISDAAAWSDTLAWATNFDTHDPGNPVFVKKAVQAQLQAMDSLDVLDVLTASLRRMLGDGESIDSLQQRRLKEFKRRMASGLQEARARARTEPCDDATRGRHARCQECLLELSRLIEAFPRRGLMKEQPGALPPKTLEERFPAEAAAVAAGRGAEGGRAPEEAEQAKHSVSAEREEEAQAATPAKDALLELIERELEHLQASGPLAAAQGPCGGPPTGPEFEQEVVPGSRPGLRPQPPPPQTSSSHRCQQEVVPGSRPGPPAVPEAGSANRKTPGPERSRPAEGAFGGEAPAAPPLPRSCEGCGQPCAASCSHCPGCQRRAERSTLTDAIAKAKEEARTKAEQDAVRKARREEAERKAEEEAARKLREDAERKVKEAEEARKAEALKLAKAEGKAKKKVAEDLICLKSHALQKFVAPAGLQCQVCGEESAQASSMWGCRYKDARGIRTCFYDVCAQCKAARSRRKLRALGEAV